MADAVAPPPPPAGWRARGAQPLHDASGARAAAVRASLCYTSRSLAPAPPTRPLLTQRPCAAAPRREAARGRTAGSPLGFAA
jgi:hypothetical protein